MVYQTPSEERKLTPLQSVAIIFFVIRLLWFSLIYQVSFYPLHLQLFSLPVAYYFLFYNPLKFELSNLYLVRIEQKSIMAMLLKVFFIFWWFEVLLVPLITQTFITYMDPCICVWDAFL